MLWLIIITFVEHTSRCGDDQAQLVVLERLQTSQPDRKMDDKMTNINDVHGWRRRTDWKWVDYSTLDYERYFLRHWALTSDLKVSNIGTKCRHERHQTPQNRKRPSRMLIKKWGIKLQDICFKQVSGMTNKWDQPQSLLLSFSGHVLQVWPLLTHGQSCDLREPHCKKNSGSPKKHPLHNCRKTSLTLMIPGTGKKRT